MSAFTRVFDTLWRGGRGGAPIASRSGATPSPPLPRRKSGLPDLRIWCGTWASPGSVGEGAGRSKFRHFTGATATAIVQTSLLRLMISRLSFGPM